MTRTATRNATQQAYRSQRRRGARSAILPLRASRAAPAGCRWPHHL